MIKKLMIVVSAAVALFFAGCKQLPTVDQMTTASKAVGAATGTVLNMTKIQDQDRNVVIDIVNEVVQCTPETNQTFTAAWTPIAERKVAKLIEEKKLDEARAKLILGAFKTVCAGMDYVFDVKYPKARGYKELVDTAVHGFGDGLLAVFKPANIVSAAKAAVDVDKDAFDYLVRKNK